MQTSDKIEMLRVLLNPVQHRNYTKMTRKGAVVTLESLTKTLGRRVDYLRDDVNNWTQEEFAQRLSKRLGRTVSQGYISKIEKNLIDPPGKVYAAMAHELNVNPAYLLGMSDDPAPLDNNPDTDIYMSEEAGEAAAIIDRLTPEKRTEMLNMLVRTSEEEKIARQKRQAEYDNLMRIVEQQLGDEARQKLERSLLASVMVESIPHKQKTTN